MKEKNLNQEYMKKGDGLVRVFPQDCQALEGLLFQKNNISKVIRFFNIFGCNCVFFISIISW